MRNVNMALRGALVVGALVGVAFITSAAVLAAFNAPAGTVSGAATLDNDFLTVSHDTVSAELGAPTVGTEDRSVVELNDWTYTRRSRPSYSW